MYVCMYVSMYVYMYVLKIIPGRVQGRGGVVRAKRKLGPYMRTKINSKSIQNWSPIWDRNRSQIGPLYGIDLESLWKSKTLILLGRSLLFRVWRRGGGPPPLPPRGTPVGTTPRVVPGGNSKGALRMIRHHIFTHNQIPESETTWTRSEEIKI